MITRILRQPRRRQWQPTPVLLPGKSHGRRSLVGCSPWGREESDTTERLHFYFSLSCPGEGNGNPLQFLPGKSQGQRSLVGCRLWGRTESDATKRLSSSKILTTSCHYLSLSPCLPKHAPLMLLFLELYFFNAFMVLPNATSTINF